jgi:hypothetical protein
MMTSHGHVQYLLHLSKDATDPRGNISKGFVKNIADSLR